MQRIDLKLEGKDYPIEVGYDTLSQLGEHCRPLGLGRRVALISERAVAEHYLAPVAASLTDAGYQVLEVVLDGGESAKNLTTMEGIFARLIEAEFDRGTWVVTLGGGVVGDMGGFVAASFLRGVPFVQVPTTIVSQVDASIGGKTAVNHALGKNLIGAFHQPRLVFIDTKALETLPRGELVAGLAEVVKHGVIRDEELFGFLEQRIEAVVDLELAPEELIWLIGRNAGIKAQVVSSDEREGGLRAILNYGHTIGHAIEAATQYRQYRHGEAVILGMIGAGQIARQLDLWSEAERQRQDDLLVRLGVPAGLASVDAGRIVECTRADKKRVAGKSRFILPRQIGQVEIVEDVDDQTVEQAVRYIQEKY